MFAAGYTIRGRQALSIALLLLACFSGWTQDLIITLNDESLEAQVLQVEKDEVIFRPMEGGETRSLPKSQLYMIAYESGMKQYFQVSARDRADEAAPVQAGSDLPADDVYLQGMADARREYSGSGPLTATFYASMIFPPVGLATGILIGASPPRIDAAQMSSPERLHNPYYAAGYQNKMHSRKVRATTTGFLAGLLVFVTWVSVLGG